MKRKTKLTLIALTACAATACAGIAAGCAGSAPKPEDYNPEYPPVTAAPDGDSIKLDGKLDESIYTDGSLKWMDLTTTGTGDEGLATTAVNVKATSTYGAEGFYLAFDVSHTPVYVDLEHNRYSYYDSCMEIYLGFPGVPALEHSYQIDIAPDGHINVQKHNGNYFMDFYLTDGINAATVKGGEINTEEANGYVMETYFPWKMFGFDEAPAAIQMDVAVIVSSREDAQGRDGWDSLAQDHKEGYGWGMPATYWHWGTNGFEDSRLTLSVADYDKSKGSVTFEKESYKAYDDVKVTVTPTEGNILKSLKVNGADRMLDLDEDVLTLPAYAEKQKLEIAAEFIARPADMVTVSGTVTKAAGIGRMDTEGKRILFRSEEGAFQTKVVDGGYSIDLMKGEYTVSLADCAELNVEITEATDSKNLVFYYRLFGEDKNNTISEDQSAVTTGKEWQDTVLNVGERFVLDYTVKFKDGLTADGGDDNFGFGYYTSGNKHYIFDHYIQGGWDYESIRDVGDFWGQLIAPNKNLAAGANAVYNFSAFKSGIPFRLIRVEDNFYWYIKTQEGAFNLIYKHTALGDVAKMTLTVWGSNVLAFDLVNIGYSDAMPEVTITAESNDNTLGTVEAPAKSQFGVPTTVVFAPAEGCLLARVTVNGVDKTSEVTNNALVFLPEDYECRIEAGFVSESDQTYEITGTLTATAGKSEVWIVPEGTELTFAGVTGSETAIVGKNGAYSVELKAGAYTVTAENFKPFALTVEGDGEINKQIVYDLIKDDGAADVNADETTVLAKAEWTPAKVNIPDANEWIFTTTMKGNSGVWKHVAQLYDGGNYIDFGFQNSDDGLKVGVGAPGNPDAIKNNGILLTAEDVDLDWTVGYKFAIVRKDNTFMAFVAHKDGKYYGVGSVTINDLAQFHLQFTSTANEWHDLSLTLGTSQFAGPFAEVDVTGTLTATAGASEPWNVPQGTVVTFSRNGETDVQVTVGENGAYTAKLKYGIYSVTANGYSGKLYVTGKTVNAQLVYDLLKDGEGTVSADETTAKSAAWAVVNVNIPTTEQWVFTCSMKTAQWATWKCALQLYDGNGYVEFGIVSTSAGLKAGVGVPNDPDYIGNNGTLFSETNPDAAWVAGYKFAIVRDGNTFTAYLQYEDGKYHEVGSTTIDDFTKFHLQFHDAMNEYHDLSLTIGTTELGNVYEEDTEA